MTKPTYHYDKHGRMIHASDYVRCYDGNEGRVLWVDDKWMLYNESIEPSEPTPLNLYAKNQLEIV